jgi:hypothetical protein
MNLIFFPVGGRFEHVSQENFEEYLTAAGEQKPKGNLFFLKIIF